MTPFELEQRRGRQMGFGLILALLVGGLAITDQRALLDTGGGAEPEEEVALSGPLMAVIGRPAARHGTRRWASALPASRRAGGLPAPRAFAARVPLPPEDLAPVGDQTTSSDLPAPAELPGDTPSQLAFGDTPEAVLPPPFNSPDTVPPGADTVPLDPDTPPSAVPEPANWAVMLLGLALIGSLTRRQRRGRKTPAAIVTVR